MDDICRLCLSVTIETQDLFENSEITLKISSCLQLEISHEDFLPDQICQNCVDRIYSIEKFLLSVRENQNLLYSHLRLGNDHLENFYTLLKNVKEENKDIKTEANHEEINVTKEFIQNTQTDKQDDIYFKQEHDFDNCHDYSSDDNTALLAFKEVKEKAINTKENITEKHKATTKKFKNSLSSPESKKKCVENNKHLKYNIELEEYKCFTCYEVVESYQDLRKHYKDKHQPTNASKFYNNSITISKVDGNKIYKCNLCDDDKTYNLRKSAKAHIVSTHQDRGPYICNECGQTFRLIRQIITHSQKHIGVKYSCSFKCGFYTVYRRGLEKHEQVKHRKQYKYKCEKCDKGFQVKKEFIEHQNFHDGVRPFVCSICSHSFIHSYALEIHKRECHPEACIDRLKGKNQLICEHCNKCFGYRALFLNHLATEHGIQQKLLCDVCGKSFNRRQGLVGHRKIHRMEKYPCSTCNKVFTTKAHLSRHTLTVHKGYKKYECLKCGKRFRDKAILNYHDSSIHGTGKRKKEKK